MDPSRLPPVPTGPQLPAEMQPGPGRLPVRRGTVFLAEETKQDLRKLGWKDGDPVPPDLAKHIAAARQAVLKEQQEATQALLAQAPGAAARAKVQKLQKDGPVPIEQLPAAERQRIAAYLQRYAEDALREEAAAQAAAANPGPDLSRMDPSVAAAYLAGEQAKTGGFAPQTVNVPGVELPPGKVLAGVIGEPPVAAKVAEAKAAADAWVKQQATAAAPPPETEPPAAEQPPSAGGDTAPHLCPWCGRDSGKTPGEITQDDKLRFFALFLGEQRFRKEVSLMSGKLKVRFRSLTLPETQIIDRQLGEDVRAQRIMGDSDWLAALTNYRFAASLEQFSLGGQTSREIPPLADSNQTMGEFHQWICDTVIVSEPVRRVLALAHRDFQRLVEHLEVAVFDPNFLAGIALPGSWLGRQPKA